MGHLFISYSRKDKKYVSKLVGKLKKEGFEVWIDDRIDYGSQWPLAIETAIDHCEFFILIASENSRQSEWVQNELARAKRLNKQIFPLLLSGDSWLSFETTQYYDVRDEKLPNKLFYANLRRYESQRFEHFRNMLIDNWLSYTNEKYHFSFCYPLNGAVVVSNSDMVHIDLPVLDGTNLLVKYLVVNCREDGILTSPLKEQSPVRNKSNSIKIHDTLFLKESGLDGGMGKIEEWISYSTLRGDKVITISLIIRYESYMLYLPALIPRLDIEAEKEVLDYVLSTFSWLE